MKQGAGCQMGHRVRPGRLVCSQTAFRSPTPPPSINIPSPCLPEVVQHRTTVQMKRQKVPISPRVSCGRVAWVSLAPFLAAVLLGSLYFRASRGSSSSSSHAVVQRLPARVLEETPRPVACLNGDCGGREGGVDATPTGSTSGSDGGGDPLAAVAADTADAAAAAVAAVPGELPKLFLFIGILSGRGYRHRRLAVREAWANQAQIPGQVVAKFILSEDERTPQVGGWAALSGSPEPRM